MRQQWEGGRKEPTTQHTHRTRTKEDRHGKEVRRKGREGGNGKQFARQIEGAGKEEERGMEGQLLRK